MIFTKVKKFRLLQAVDFLRGSLGESLPLLDNIEGFELKNCLQELHEQYKNMRKEVVGKDEEIPPVLSVVIPVYFKEKGATFLTAMKSLLANKNTPPTEIVVVLNGKVSTSELMKSESYTMAEKIGVRLLTLSYSENEKYRNIGWPQIIFTAKQSGFEEAQGSIVIAGDIDNIFSDKWINAYKEAFDKDQDLIAAYGPVQLYGTTGSIGKLMTWISALAKSLKILIDFPPFAGHNHAIRKEIYHKVPHLYERIVMDCHEIPGILKKALSLNLKISHFVRCVPEAIVSTYFPEQTESKKGAVRWFTEATIRNIRTLRRVRSNIRSSQ